MKEKLKKEGSILKLSVLLSAIFIVVEFIMAIFSKSQTLLMDCVFGFADILLIVIMTFLLPLIYKPVTERRPYGYSQIESIFIIIKGVSVAIITLFLIRDNIDIMLNGGSNLDLSIVMLFQIMLEIFCIISYLFLKYKSRKIETPVVEADLVAWKIDMFTTLGMFLSFFVQFILRYTSLYFIVPYIDSIVAIVISLVLIKEPIAMVIEAFRNLVLFAPEKETIQEIKEIVTKKIEKYPYEVTFYDIVRTGRKIWIELYIKSDNSNINLLELKNAKGEVELSLKKQFDEIYVEFTPEI